MQVPKYLLIFVPYKTIKTKTMLVNYTNLKATIKFENGRSFGLYCKKTVRGIRYFYWSPSNGRMMPIATDRAADLMDTVCGQPIDFSKVVQPK